MYTICLVCFIWQQPIGNVSHIILINYNTYTIISLITKAIFEYTIQCMKLNEHAESHSIWPNNNQCLPL